jgi:hypothetical protein
MNQQNGKIFACLLLSLTFIWGCSSQKIPEGFPKKLVKFSVTILHEGKPVENALVWFYPDDSNAKYHVRATTNTNGIALMETSINSYSKTGVPVSTFKGTVTHRPKVPSDLTKEEWQKLNYEEAVAQGKKIATEVSKMKLTPLTWENLTMSPLKITIPENGGNVTIEITDSKTWVPEK